MKGLGPKVSVIIPCRNEAGEIENCIRSILACDAPVGGFEVIVADGGSDDGTRELLDALAAKAPQVKVIENSGRIVSTGLNAAIGAARGEVIIRMDAHTTYAKDYICRCVGTLEATGADNVGGPARTVAKTWMGKAIRAGYHSPFSVGGARFHDVNYEGTVDTVTYGCWKREAFDRFGYFDEGLVRNQDDEHNLRVVRGGGKIWQNPAITSFYQVRPTLGKLFKQYRQYGYWKVKVIQKHKLPASIRHLVPGLFLLSLLVLSALSSFSIVAWSCLILLLMAYFSVLLVASVQAARREGWSLLPVLPAVFACYHFGYGLGFLMGIIDFVILKRRVRRGYTEITRGSFESCG